LTMAAPGTSPSSRRIDLGGDEHFEILDVESKHRGEKLLTPEIEAELSEYSKDDLLKRSIRVMMRKP